MSTIPANWSICAEPVSQERILGLKLNDLFISVCEKGGMIISHSRKFIVFNDPLDSGHEIERALFPFGDVSIQALPNANGHPPFFHGMTPIEAEWAFDAAGFAFQTYLRISIVESPFARLSRLYDRIAQTDKFWQFRRLAGLGQPSFTSWLQTTKADGFGAGHRNSPRWRQYGSWSTRHWERGRVNHTIRVEEAEDDLGPVLRELGIAPSALPPRQDRFSRETLLANYTSQSSEFVSRRYGWDLAQFGYSAPRLHKAA